MDETPQIEPIVTPTEKKMNPPRAKLVMVFAVVLLLATAGIVLFTVLGRLRQNQKEAIVPTPTPLPPTPTPIRVLSRIATEAAFLNFESSVASLSAVVVGYPITDPGLTPPKLELSLGFSR